jgi:hypothetical protein
MQVIIDKPPNWAGGSWRDSPRHFDATQSLKKIVDFLRQMCRI